MIFHTRLFIAATDIGLKLDPLFICSCHPVTQVGYFKSWCALEMRTMCNLIIHKRT